MSRFISLAIPGLMLAALLTPAAHAQEDYRTVSGPRLGDDPDVIEVVEFFWYGCPHCFNFEPLITEWKRNLPDDVTFRYVPAVFSPKWELHGRAYYAAKAMGVLDRFHDAMFKALHEQDRRLDSEKRIGRFVSELGIDGSRFVETMNSFAVNTRIKRARSLQKAYAISGTPSVVIDGRYVTSGSLAGSLENLIEVVDERVTAARSSAQDADKKQ